MPKQFTYAEKHRYHEARQRGKIAATPQQVEYSSIIAVVYVISVTDAANYEAH